MIRAHIKKIAGECEIINVYVPRIAGKEKRKAHFGKEGILGVEGMTPEILEEALLKSGVTAEKTDRNLRKIAKKRHRLLKKLSLPENLSPNAMLDILNTYFTFDEFCEVTENWQAEETEN